MNAQIPESLALGEEAGDWPRTEPLSQAPPAPASGTVITRELAFEIFGLVFHQMRSLVGRRPELDDLVQIAAEQAVRSLGSFESRSKMATWTYSICYFTFLKHQRWYGRWLRIFALTERGDLPEIGTQAHDESQLESRERALCLRHAIDRLSPKRRAVVVLHDLEGLSIDQVAHVVKAKALTVRSRLRDGRKDLARILAKDSYFGDEACAGQEVER